MTSHFKNMKTIAELEQHLHDHRLKKIDLPTYGDLIELVEASSGVIGAVADYMTKAKEREAKLLNSAFDLGVKFFKNDSLGVFYFVPKDLIYEEAGIEELK